MFEINDANAYPKVFIPNKFFESKNTSPTFEEFISVYNITKPKSPKKAFVPQLPPKTKIVNQTKVVVKKNTGCFYWFFVAGLII